MVNNRFSECLGDPGFEVACAIALIKKKMHNSSLPIWDIILIYLNYTSGTHQKRKKEMNYS